MAVETGQLKSAAAAQPEEFRASERYRYYVVWFLFVVYVFNFVDRQILTTLIEPIKHEFGLHDWQLGALSGTAFALFYTTFGIPIARWADKGNRVNIIALSLLVWSTATAVTGFVRNFWQLFLARVVVGIGESGCSPPALSLISDYFEPKRRSRALSIYAMGVYGGTFIGLMMGGVVAQMYGWRAAFLIVGLPGVALALVLKLSVREPPRGFSEGGAHTVKDAPPMATVVRSLGAKSSFRHLAFAAGLHAFVSYGVSAFYNSYLIRSHGFTVAQAGVWLAFLVGFGGLLGTYVGGTYADKLTQRHGDSRYMLKVPAISNLISLPFAAAAFALSHTPLVLICLFLYVCFGTMYLAPSISATYRLVTPRERALATAVLFLVLNFIGIGVGPLLTGFISHTIGNNLLEAGMPAAQASADGLRYALCIIVFTFAWSTFHYYRAMRTLRQAELAA